MKQFSNLAIKRGFTLMELLIVIGLIVILGTIAIILLDPKKQLEKAWDGKRKHELSTLKKVFEDFYNDKNCYPRPDEVCYKDKTSTACPICGRSPTSPNLSPYLPKLPCNPSSPQKDYLYQVDNTSCPTWYRIYTKLSNTNDPAIIEVGCQYGCGVAPDFTYNYGVGSPNIGLQANTNLCSSFGSLYIIAGYTCPPPSGPCCNICGSYNLCQTNYPGETYYIDPGGGGIPGCTIVCIKD